IGRLAGTSNDSQPIAVAAATGFISAWNGPAAPISLSLSAPSHDDPNELSLVAAMIRSAGGSRSRCRRWPLATACPAEPKRSRTVWSIWGGRALLRRTTARRRRTRRSGHARSRRRPRTRAAPGVPSLGAHPVAGQPALMSARASVLLAADDEELGTGAG